MPLLRIIKLPSGDFRIVCLRVPLEETIGLQLETNQRAIDIPREIVLEAARRILREIAQSV